MSVDHKVLLLTHNLAHFAGAEINILQLARAFRERGWNVEIGAFVYGNPIKEIFGKEGFNVSNVLHEDPSRKEYDLIWAQHAPVLNQVIFNKKIKSKKIIYSSLSPIEPLESAPIYINNLSLCLANSQETAKSLIQQGVKRSILQIFVNSVDEEFFKAYQQNRGKHLGKIAIVSNHVPSELGEAGALLRDEGYEVACFGYGKEFKFITPEILSNFDAVVTIGKTVQFSLAMGIPVYCYDHFGGPGWISKENFDTAGYYNFSGRGFNRRLTPRKIFREVTKGYSAAFWQRAELRELIERSFNFNQNFNKIVNNIERSKDVDWNQLDNYKLIEGGNQIYIREFLSRMNLSHQTDSMQKLNVVLEQLVKDRENHISLLLVHIESMRIKSRLKKLIKPFIPSVMRKNIEALLARISKAFWILKNEGPKMLIQNAYGFLFNKNYSHFKIYTRWVSKVESRWLKNSKKQACRYKDTNIKISIVMPVYNVDPKYLSKAIRSIKKQAYSNWELCIYDDASTNFKTKGYLSTIEGTDERIKIKYGEKNGHISYATNRALELATGDFVLFMDNDDELSETALYEIAKRIRSNPSVDLIYYDEDVITPEGRRIFPIFKPGYSPDTLLSIMYMAHSTYRRSLVEKVGSMRKGYEGSQDYDLVLRVTEKTKNIIHIPHVLYHWRQAPGSTAGGYEKKDYAHESAMKALRDAIKRRKLNAQLEEGLTIVSFRIKYKINRKPKVSIVIPTKDHVDDLDKCIKSIEEKTDYKNYEIIIVNNNSKEKKSFEYFTKLSKKHIVLEYPHPFNFAAINNFATKHSAGEHLLMLNNDTKVISSEWLAAMLEFSQQDSVGAVGAMLLFPDDTFQHAGCVLGLGGVAGHIYVGQPKIQHGMLDRTLTIHNTSAVTGACMMIRKDKYENVGGMDEKLAVAFNDIDLCIKLMDKGLKNIYTPFAQLYHYESKTRGYEDTLEKQIRFKSEIDYITSKWGEYIDKDPYYNPNLSLKRDDFSMDV